MAPSRSESRAWAGGRVVCEGPFLEPWPRAGHCAHGDQVASSHPRSAEASGAPVCGGGDRGPAGCGGKPGLQNLCPSVTCGFRAGLRREREGRRPPRGPDLREGAETRPSRQRVSRCVVRRNENEVKISVKKITQISNKDRTREGRERSRDSEAKGGRAESGLRVTRIWRSPRLLRAGRGSQVGRPRRLVRRLHRGHRPTRSFCAQDLTWRRRRRVGLGEFSLLPLR